MIPENMLSQVDSKGDHNQVLKEISDHSADGSALNWINVFIISHIRNLQANNTTRGSKLKFEWKDGTLSWIPLKDIKASNPVELSNYVVSNNIEYEPSFKWWVKDVLLKRYQIILKVKAAYWRATHNFGIQVPKTVCESYKIYQKKGTTFWKKSIEKEMDNFRVAFEVLKGVKPEQTREVKVK